MDIMLARLPWLIKTQWWTDCLENLYARYTASERTSRDSDQTTTQCKFLQNHRFGDLFGNRFTQLDEGRIEEEETELAAEKRKVLMTLLLSEISDFRRSRVPMRALPAFRGLLDLLN